MLFNTFSSIPFENILDEILKLPSISSKNYLVNKVDRSVSGKVVQQQCIGPYQVPLSNYSCASLSYFPNDFKGIVSSIGERPLIGFGDYGNMVNMTVGEMLTNIIGILITDIKDIKISGNWMWSPKKNNIHGYNLYTAVTELSKTLSSLCIAIDGGKDSLSMNSRNENVNDKITDVYSLPTLVLTSYVTSSNFTKRVTPDLKKIGSSLIYIPFNLDLDTLGGSCLLQVLNLLSYSVKVNTPNICDSAYLLKLFRLIQNMIKKDKILALHDISDGGLIVTLIEMTISSNIGIHIDINNTLPYYKYLFNEGLGIVIEIDKQNESNIFECFNNHSIYYKKIGVTNNKDLININYNYINIYVNRIINLKKKWEETSYQLEKYQNDIKCVEIERSLSYSDIHLQYYIPENVKKLLFKYNKIIIDNLNNDNLKSVNKRFNVAIIRSPSSNSYREMENALYVAGFNVYDLTINDLIKNSNLDKYSGIVFVGGFSNGDIPFSGIGMATQLNQSKIKEEFIKFKNRSDTFSLGICNGCQVQSYLPFIDIEYKMLRNESSKFESRWSLVKIGKNNNIFLHNLENMVFGIWSAHGEGRFFIDEKLLNDNINIINYCNSKHKTTEHYPENPNGSINGIAGLSSNNGRHLVMMPHPERCFINWQLPYTDINYDNNFSNTYYSPWILIFINAYNWCSNKIID